MVGIVRAVFIQRDADVLGAQPRVAGLARAADRSPALAHPRAGERDPAAGGVDPPVVAAVRIRPGAVLPDRSELAARPGRAPGCAQRPAVPRARRRGGTLRHDGHPGDRPRLVHRHVHDRVDLLVRVQRVLPAGIRDPRAAAGAPACVRPQGGRQRVDPAVAALLPFRARQRPRDAFLHSGAGRACAGRRAAAGRIGSPGRAHAAGTGAGGGRDRRGAGAGAGVGDGALAGRSRLPTTWAGSLSRA